MPPAVSTSIEHPTSAVGVDDGPFPPKSDRRLDYAPLVAAHLTGSRLTGLAVEWITVDGLDATSRAVAILAKLSKCPVLMSGVTFGGFNLIDPRRIQSRFKVPTLVVVGSRPDNRAVKRALADHFPDWKERWEVIRSLGPLRKARTLSNEPPIFYEALGCSASDARKILKKNAWVSRVPEPIRVAGLVARGLFSETSRDPF